MNRLIVALCILGFGGNSVYAQKKLSRSERRAAAAAKAAFSISFEPSKPNGLFWGQDKPAGTLTFEGTNTLPSPMPVRVSLLDQNQKVVSQIWEGEVDFGPGKTVRQEIKMPVTADGFYFLRIDADSATHLKPILRLKAPAPVWKDSPLGVELDEVPEPDEIRVMRQMGVAWVRFPLLWSSVETAKANYDFTALDAIFKTMHASGIQPLVVLHGGNPLYDDGAAPVSSAGLNGFAGFSAAVATRYKAQCSHFEVWDRPNGASWQPKPDPKAYTALLKITDQALKKANPNSTVLGMSAAGVASDYLEEAFGPWDGSFMDALSVRPNGIETAAFEKSISRLKSRLGIYGAGDYDMWLTHFGPVSNSNKSVPASGLLRAAITALSRGYVVRLFLSPWQDAKIRASDTHHGVLTADGLPSGSFAGIHTLATVLNGKEYSRAVPISTYISGHEFSGAAGNMLAVWSVAAWQNLGLKFDATEISVTDDMGNQEVVKTTQGRISFPVSTSPVFITGYKTVEVAPTLLQWAGRTSLVPGEKTTLTATLPEGIAHSTYSVSAPEGWNATMGTDGLLHIQTPANATMETYYVAVKAPSLGKVESRLPISLSELSTMTATSPEPGKATLTINHPVALSRPFTLKTTSYQAGKAPIVKDETITLGPNSTTPMTVAVTPLETNEGFQLGKLVATLTTNTKTARTASAYSGKTPIYTFKPSIDGNIAEWAKLKPCLLNQSFSYTAYEEAWVSPEHFSAKFWAGQDEKNFYLAADVNDKNHSCKWGGQYLQYGDLVKICFLNAGHAYIFTAGLVDDGTVDFARIYPSYVKPVGMQARVVRNGNKTFYEVSIPWAQIGLTEESRKTLQFAVNVQNWKNKLNMGWLEWFHGGAYAYLYGPIDWRK